MTRIQRIVLRHQIEAARRVELDGSLGPWCLDKAQTATPWPPVVTRRTTHERLPLPALDEQANFNA